MSKRESSKKRDPRFEYPDPVPISVPVRFQRPPSQMDDIKTMIRNAMSMEAESREQETFEEANDFELDPSEEDPFVSNYEFDEMSPETHEAIDPTPSLSNTEPQAEMPEGHVSEAKQNPTEQSAQVKPGEASPASRETSATE